MNIEVEINTMRGGIGEPNVNPDASEIFSDAAPYVPLKHRGPEEKAHSQAFMSRRKPTKSEEAILRIPSKYIKRYPPSVQRGWKRVRRKYNTNPETIRAVKDIEEED